MLAILARGLRVGNSLPELGLVELTQLLRCHGAKPSQRVRDTRSYPHRGRRKQRQAGHYNVTCPDRIHDHERSTGDTRGRHRERTRLEQPHHRRGEARRHQRGPDVDAKGADEDSQETVRGIMAVIHASSTEIVVDDLLP